MGPAWITRVLLLASLWAPAASTVGEVSLQMLPPEMICRCEGVQTRPAVSWTADPGPSFHQTSIESSDTGLFSVLSSVLLPGSLSPPYEYSCNVSTEHGWRSATYRANPQISSSGSVTVPCTEPTADVKSLVWRFKHSETVLTRTGSESVYTESWRRFVEGLTESNGLVLKDLTQDQQGLFSCVLSTETEQFIINTEVTVKETSKA